MTLDTHAPVAPVDSPSPIVAPGLEDGHCVLDQLRHVQGLDERSTPVRGSSTTGMGIEAPGRVGPRKRAVSPLLSVTIGNTLLNLVWRYRARTLAVCR